MLLLLSLDLNFGYLCMDICFFPVVFEVTCVILLKGIRAVWDSNSCQKRYSQFFYVGLCGNHVWSCRGAQVMNVSKETIWKVPIARALGRSITRSHDRSIARSLGLELPSPIASLPVFFLCPKDGLMLLAVARPWQHSIISGVFYLSLQHLFFFQKNLAKLISLCFWPQNICTRRSKINLIYLIQTTNL